MIIYHPPIGFNNKWWRKVIFMIFETDVVGSIYPQSKSYGGSGKPPFKVLEEIQSTMIKKMEWWLFRKICRFIK